MPTILRFACAALLAATAAQDCRAQADTATGVDALEIQRRDADAAAQDKRYAQAATLYEAIAMSRDARSEGDAGLLLAAAQNYQRDGQHLKATTLFERAMEVPVAPSAHPPAWRSGPVDLRGEARWGTAESSRALGKWAEALALYRLNRKKYPRGDGCVPSGAAHQEMAMAEGDCLEHLGRSAEAVAGYWRSALNLSSDIQPHAMRRLVDLYPQAGQMPVLQAAMARVSRTSEATAKARAEHDPRGQKFEEQHQKALELSRAYSPMAAFQRVQSARQLARLGRWDALLQQLKHDPRARQEGVVQWRRREATSALALGAPESVPALERASQSHPENPYIKAALVACGARRESDFSGSLSWDTRSAIEDIMGYFPTIHTTPAPAPLRLPSALPVILDPFFVP